MDFRDQRNLLDPNMDKKIAKCFINEKGRFTNVIHVIYEDGSRENIHTYNTNKYEFSHTEFIGKTKIDAVFYCDRKKPLNGNTYGRTIRYY